MGKFSYQARPAANWQQRSEQKGGSFISYLVDKVSLFSPQKGLNWVRILPPTWVNPQHYGYDVWLHQYIGPQQATVLCPLKHNRGKCPICECYTAGEAQGKEYDDLYEFKATRRVLTWFLNRNKEQKGEADCVQAWALPWKFDRDVSMVCKDPLTGELYQIDHPEIGFDITFNKEGEQDRTTYGGIQLARKSTTVDDKWLDYIVANPLPDMLLWRDYDEIRALFEGAAEKPAETTAPGTVAPAPAPTATQAVDMASLFGPGPTEAAPTQQAQTTTAAPVQQAATAQQTVEAFCEKSIVYRGSRIACNLPVGHEPKPCDFQRDMGPLPPSVTGVGTTTQAAQSSAPVQPAAVLQPSVPATTMPPSNQGTPTTVATTTTTTTTSPRAAALRERFTKKN